VFSRGNCVAAASMIFSYFSGKRRIARYGPTRITGHGGSPLLLSHPADDLGLQL